MTNKLTSVEATINTDFLGFCQHYRTYVEGLIDKQLSLHESREHSLTEAMRYGLLGGGKRVRALLAYAAAEVINTPTALTDTSAIALEAIHAYSLIHDDLPAMDDDQLRRGKPTCHIAFDEATAILAGDALQTLAFEQLSQPHTDITAETQLAMIATLSSASGQFGMVAGQSIDISAVNQQLNMEELTTMHALKTGALIRASVLLGAYSTGCAQAAQINALSDYADAIGLAFQIQDDILDVTSDTQTLGKQQGADAALQKPTFISLMGLEAAKEKANELHQQALTSIKSFGSRAVRLEELASYIIDRQY